MPAQRLNQIGVSNQGPINSVQERMFIASTLFRDAMTNCLDIDYKLEYKSVRLYRIYNSRLCSFLSYSFMALNLSTALVEDPVTRQLGFTIPYYYAAAVNLVCFTFFILRWVGILRMSKRDSLIRNPPFYLTIILIVAMIIDEVVYLIIKITGRHAYMYLRCFRPLLLITMPENRRLRVACSNLINTLFDVIPVFALFLFSILFMSVICLKLLQDEELKSTENKPYFFDFANIFWELYVLTTTANSPDVIVPAYESHGAYIIIYILVCIISNWLFTGIMTASIYNAYKNHLKESVLSAAMARKSILKQAFYLLAGNSDSITLDTFLSLMRRVDKKRSIAHSTMLFNVLDRDKLGTLDVHEFTKLSEMLHFKITEVPISREYFAKRFPPCYSFVMSKFSRKVAQVKSHRYTEMFFQAMIVVNGIAMVLTHRTPYDTTLEWFFTIFFLLELILSYYGAGCTNFFNDPWNIFDTVVVVLCCLGLIIQKIYPDSATSDWSVFLKIFLLLRTIRLIKLVNQIPTFRTVLLCVMTSLPALAVYLAMLMGVFYFVTCIATSIYGLYYFAPHDYVSNRNMTYSKNCENSKLEGSVFLELHYCLFNFNSILDGFILMLVLMVGNNWHIFADGFVLVTNRYSRIFFVAVHMFCVLLVLNIVLAFIIEAFLVNYDMQESKLESEVKQRMIELNIDAETELAKRGLGECKKVRFVMSRELLERAFPEDSDDEEDEEQAPQVAFTLETQSAAIELLLLRMFSDDISEMVEHYESVKKPFFRVFQRNVEH